MMMKTQEEVGMIVHEEEEELHDDDSHMDHTNDNDKTKINNKDDQAVNRLRIITFFVLVIVAVGVSCVAYFYMAKSEQDDMETQFVHYAGRVVDAFEANTQRRLAALEAFSEQITSYGQHAQIGESFPMITLPDFERKAAHAREISQVVSIILYMVVTHEQRSAWENYTATQTMTWVQEGMALQPAAAANNNSDTEMLAILENTTNSPYIHTPWEPVANVSDLYLPVWTMSPTIPYTPKFVNLDMYGNPLWKAGFDSMRKNKKNVIHKADDFSDEELERRSALLQMFFSRWQEGGNKFQRGPVSEMWIPILSSFDDDETSELVGVINVHLYWQAYLLDLLPDNARGVICILENTCGQQFTYVIDGAEASYIGPGDLHDPKYDHLEQETGFDAIVSQANVDEDYEGQCFYNIRLYPSEELENEYLSNRPWIFTLVLVSVFIFTSLVFITYDRLVHHRHTVVNKQAVESSAVVASLFPENVREGVVDIYTNPTNNHHHQKEKPADMGGTLPKMPGGGGGDWDDSAPIANLHPDCTVMFADIAGFTKWSSSRGPAEVFKLLETLYGAFDAIAKRRKVFKIETIGDCYVAVTGLPQPQEDHAIIMTKFAGDCIVKLNQLMHILVEKLGEDTAELSMRFGLHSGPVIAGVLRGEKARFQLFGDTVNTAARMESNGQRNRIHVSESTADLLLKGGKQNWVTARDDKIHAKGKGELQTYWVNPPSFGGAGSTVSKISSYNPNTTAAAMKPLSSPLESKNNGDKQNIMVQIPEQNSNSISYT